MPFIYDDKHLSQRRTMRKRRIHWSAVIWSETVGLRTRPVWDQKIGLGLAGLVLWCETRSCQARLVRLVVIMILKDTAPFRVLFIISIFWSWNITTVEINSGVYLTVYLTVKSFKCLCLLLDGIGLGVGLANLVFVLRIWSCLHHWDWAQLKACICAKCGHWTRIVNEKSAQRDANTAHWL